MSTTETARPTGRPAAPTAIIPTPFSQDDCPTAIIPAVPTRRSILRAAGASGTGPLPGQGPFADWRGQCPPDELPAVSSDTGRPSSGARRSRRPRVSTPAKPTGSRERLADASTGTNGLRRRGTLSRHLRAALTAIALAAALLGLLSSYASQGISDARRGALQDRRQTSASAAPMSGQSTHAEQGAPTTLSEQSPDQPDWVTEQTGAAYDRTNPAASPLDLPRCTTSPDTPLPCLATISPSQTRAVVLEEDASLTALVRR